MYRIQNHQFPILGEGAGEGASEGGPILDLAGKWMGNPPVSRFGQNPSQGCRIRPEVYGNLNRGPARHEMMMLPCWNRPGVSVYSANEYCHSKLIFFLVFELSAFSFAGSNQH